MASVDRSDACTALRATVPRLSALIRSASDPATPALGSWDVAGVAAHLSHAFDVVPALTTPDAAALIDDLWDLAQLTVAWVDRDEERDLAVLAERIDTRAEAFLAAVDGRADASFPWIVEGHEVPLTVLVCHLLNETLVHGHDIAVAAGLDWKIEPRHAALVVEGFLVPILARLDPSSLVQPSGDARFRARYDIRLRGAGRFGVVLRDGGATVVPSLEGRADCHLSVDPTGFLLVLWGRRSQWHALRRGQLLAWGRRPWVGLQLRSRLRTP
ncbi:MAG: hypothetical protein H0W25_05955 [Acidimicrobiia bacterium]|nr:hypothetical protein [Acidimicrobiia bacterium]